MCRYIRTVFYDDYQSPRFTLTQPLVYYIGQTVAAMDRVVDTVESLSKDEGKWLGFVLNDTVQSVGGYGKYGYGKYGGGYYGEYSYYHSYSKH